MVDGADGTIASNDKGYNEEGDGHNSKGLAVRQTDGDDTASKLPGCCIESVGDPVC